MGKFQCKLEVQTSGTALRVFVTYGNWNVNDIPKELFSFRLHRHCEAPWGKSENRKIFQETCYKLRV